MSRLMLRGALVATCLIAVSQGLSLADENFWWRVDHFDTLVNQPVSNRFETEREALAYKQKWEKVENLSKRSPAYINWKITKERKPAKPDAGKAKDANNGGKKGGDLLARLREAKDAADKTQLSRAIEDYKQAVEDAYQRIKDFEKTLLGGTQEMQEKRFREINSLVDRYNRQISDFQSVMGPTVPLGYRSLAQFEAQQPTEEKPLTPVTGFQLYTIENDGSGGKWQLSSAHESLEAAKAAGERYLFASKEQRSYAIVDLRVAGKQIGDRPSFKDLYDTAIVYQAKPWGGRTSGAMSTARNPRPR